MPERWMMARLRFSSSCILGEAAIRREKPITEFKGVRSSWLMFARKVLLARFAACAWLTATDRALVRSATSSSR
ncbi:hypothetical protein D3C72_1703830 [compost metagenome]